MKDRAGSSSSSELLASSDRNHQDLGKENQSRAMATAGLRQNPTPLLLLRKAVASLDWVATSEAARDDARLTLLLAALPAAGGGFSRQLVLLPCDIR